MYDILLQFLVARIVYLETELDRAKGQAAADPLTGLFNRRVLDDQLRKAFAKAARSHQPLSLLVIDIDNFKEVNDTKGHQSGDAILRKVAHRLVEKLRSFDHVFRYGGEEFVILLSNTPVAVAYQVAERLRKGIKQVGVTVSIGVASTEEAPSPTDLVARADRAMYDAKKQGRNRVVVSKEVA